MANLQCQPATDITASTATLNGTGDSIPANHFLRIAYGATSGGPYSSNTGTVAGNNSVGQSVSGPANDLSYDADYFYVIQELDTDGTTVLDTSAECTLHTDTYDPQCEFVTVNGGQGTATVRVTADWVPTSAQLQVEYATTPGGPYTVVASQAGTNTENQTFDANLTDLPPCQPIVFRARVNDVPVQYFATWSYAHGNRTGVPETLEMRLNGILIDTDVVGPPTSSTPALWNVKSGVYPVPPGTTMLDMRFIAIAPANTADNHIDSMSIILTTDKGQNLGEQLVNGGFEVPDIGANNITFVTNTQAAIIPGFGWRSTPIGGWPDGVIELWSDFADGNAGPDPVAHTGKQHAELNAPGQIFQEAELARAFVASDECQLTPPTALCLPATNVGQTSATLNGQSCGIFAGSFSSFQYGLCSENIENWTHETPLIYNDGSTDQDFFSHEIALECGLQYCYRAIIRDPQLEIISNSALCQFSTDGCLVWCGTHWDADSCTLVGEGENAYFNCWPIDIRDGFPGEGLNHA